MRNTVLIDKAGRYFFLDRYDILYIYANKVGEL